MAEMRVEKMEALMVYYLDKILVVMKVGM